VSSDSLGSIGPKRQYISIEMSAPYTLAQIDATSTDG
jgi:hypothetical protein